MAAFKAGSTSAWDWTMMISQPAWITRDLVRETLSQVAAKKQLPALGRLRVMGLDEGLCVQILHIGPYHEEGPVLHRIRPPPKRPCPASQLETLS